LAQEDSLEKQAGSFLEGPGDFEILGSNRCIFLRFEAYFYVALLFLEVSQLERQG